jgi:hypothetical protein
MYNAGVVAVNLKVVGLAPGLTENLAREKKCARQCDQISPLG